MTDAEIEEAVAHARAMSDEDLGRLLRPLFCEKHLAALVMNRDIAKPKCLPCCAKRSMKFLAKVWANVAKTEEEKASGFGMLD